MTTVAQKLGDLSDDKLELFWKESGAAGAGDDEMEKIEAERDRRKRKAVRDAAIADHLDTQRENEIRLADIERRLKEGTAAKACTATIRENGPSLDDLCAELGRKFGETIALHTEARQAGQRAKGGGLASSDNLGHSLELCVLHTLKRSGVPVRGVMTDPSQPSIATILINATADLDWEMDQLRKSIGAI